MPPRDPPATSAKRPMPSRSARAHSDPGLVARGRLREGGPVRLAGRGVDGRRAGGPVAAAEEVGAQDADPVGVERPAGADERVPTSRRRRRPSR